MASEDEGDRTLRGADRPEPAPPRQQPWTIPIVAALVSAAAIVVNGWFAYVASSSKELVEARNETLQRQLDDVGERVGELNDRLTHLERLRMSGLERTPPARDPAGGAD